MSTHYLWYVVWHTSSVTQLGAVRLWQCRLFGRTETSSGRVQRTKQRPLVAGVLIRWIVGALQLVEHYCWCSNKSPGCVCTNSALLMCGECQTRWTVIDHLPVTVGSTGAKESIESVSGLGKGRLIGHMGQGPREVYTLSTFPVSCILILLIKKTTKTTLCNRDMAGRCHHHRVETLNKKCVM